MMAHLMQKHEWIADADVDRLLSEAVQTFDEADGELVQPVVVVDDLIAILVEIQPDGTGNHVRVVDKLIDGRRVLDFRYQVYQVQILVNQRLPDETGRLSAGEILAVNLMRGVKLEAVDKHLAELFAGQAGIRMFRFWNLRLRYQLNQIMGRAGRHERLRVKMAGAVAHKIAHLMQIQNRLIVRVCLGDVREAGLRPVLVDPCIFRDVHGMGRTGNQQTDQQSQEPDSRALQGI